MTTTTNQKLSKYQTWQPWINEYNRLTTTGHSNQTAARQADALVDAKLATMRRALRAA
jgi:hypothetical protein